MAARLRLALVISVGTCALLASAAANAEKKPFNIALLFDGPPKPEWARFIERLREETISLTKDGRRRVSFPATQRRVGDWSVATTRDQAAQLLKAPEVDLIVAVGLLGGLELARQPQLSKPVLIPLAPDPSFSGLPLKGAVSGKHNLGYVGYAGNLEQDITGFAKLTGTKHVHVLVDRVVFQAIGQSHDFRRAVEARTKVRLSSVVVDGDVDRALAAIPKQAKAIYITPLLRFDDARRRALFDGLKARRLLSFSMTGRAEVERGVLATKARGMDFLRAARRTALNIERVLRGEDPATFDVFLERQGQLLLNMATAQAIGFSPSFQTLVTAELVGHTKPNGKPTMGLQQAIRIGLRRNWTIASASAQLRAARAQLQRAYSGLGPRLDFVFEHQTVRKATAEASNGAQPYHQGKLAGRLTQPLFVEPLFAGVGANKRLYRGAQQRHDLVQLEIASAIAATYIDVLRAAAQLRIRRANTQLTVENLESARVRERLGATPASDLHRWESQLAQDRARLVLAQTARDNARIALARLLAVDINDLGTLADLGDQGVSLASQTRAIRRYLENPLVYRRFVDFVVDDAIRRTPELGQLRETVLAQERVFASTSRALYLPKVQLQGELSYLPYRETVGAEPLTLPGVGTIEFGNIPRFSWFIGVGLNLPLFHSFDQYFAKRQAHAELMRLKSELRSAGLGVTMAVRTSINNARAARAAIFFAERAAVAARKNLTIAQQAYARGAVTVVRLLDAQNQSLGAEVAQATAGYDFQKALVAVQRAIGHLQGFLSESACGVWLKRLQEHMEHR
ncbi:MAG: TolC family protein [Deltaproteobacteria bacterium]|nr:TolC family protein [Deltaproteobacteria bacterium]